MNSPESMTTITKDDAVTEPESPSISRRMSAAEPEGEPEDSSVSGPTPISSQSPVGDAPIVHAPNDEAAQLTTVLESLSLAQVESSAPVPEQISPAITGLKSQAGQSSHVNTTVHHFQPARPPASQSGNSSSSIPNSPQASSRPSSRLHNNAPARLSSPPSRDHPSLFVTSSFGRPPSVASNHSYARAPFATGKAAPAMAVTTSDSSNRMTGNSTLSTDELNPFMETTRTRRKSSAQSLIQQEDTFRPGPNPTHPHDPAGSPSTSGSRNQNSTHSPIFMQSAGGSSQAGQSGLGVGMPSSGQGAFGTPGTTPSPGTSPGAGASRLMRGFSIRKRTPSGMEPPAIPQKASAMDLLRRFEGSGTG
jgi:hypothetical protein